MNKYQQMSTEQLRLTQRYLETRLATLRERPRFQSLIPSTGGSSNVSGEMSRTIAHLEEELSLVRAILQDR